MVEGTEGMLPVDSGGSLNIRLRVLDIFPQWQQGVTEHISRQVTWYWSDFSYGLLWHLYGTKAIKFNNSSVIWNINIARYIF